jgi:hypothetical protein
MKHVSVKTLILLFSLLTFAVACCGTAWTPAVRAAVTWLDDDPNEATDPNLPVDPNVSASPGPEMILSTGSLLWLSAMPADVNEPNQPPQPQPPENM